MRQLIIIVLFSLAFSCPRVTYGASKDLVVSQQSHGVNSRENYILSTLNDDRKLCLNLTTNMCDCSYASSSDKNKTDGGKRMIALKCHSIHSIDVKSLPKIISTISLTSTRLNELNESSFPMEEFSHLTEMTIFNDLTLVRIGARSFRGLKNLTNIHLKRLPKLIFISDTAFVNLTSIQDIILERTGLKYVQGFRGMTEASEVFQISITNNQYLERIPAKSFSCQVDHLKLFITDNKRLRIVEDLAFSCTFIESLFLNDNKMLSILETEVFTDMRISNSPMLAYGEHLTKLNISNTNVGRLPTNGLQDLEELFASNTPNLIVFPHRNEIPSLTKAWLTYTYHCCALNPQYGFGNTFEKEKKNPADNARPCNNQDPGSDSYSGEDYNNKERSKRSSDENIYDDIFWNDDQFWKLFLRNLGLNESNKDTSEIYLSPNDSYIDTELSSDDSEQEQNSASVEPGVIHMCDENQNEVIFYPTIECHPRPDLFNPCEDVLGGMGVNVASWIIALLALFGNFMVIVVTVASWFNCSAEETRPISVSKFLILHLAIADFWMGIYVLMLSVMSTITTKRYYQYGAYWQALGGCDVAGFLSVFSLEMSVFTLSVVSAERWYAIRNAIQLEKRLTLPTCKVVMAVGWTGAIVLAALPIFGVNTYRKSAICLPLSTSTLTDQVYIGVILLLYIMAFLVVVTSYVWMWTIVRSNNHFKCSTVVKQLAGKVCCSPFTSKIISNERRGKKRTFSNWNNADSRIAKRMAVLVFTDFFSFFPICLFAIFAFLNMPLVSMSTTKVLLAVFFPLNSCCNPFVYAVLTKSFRKDLRRVINGSRSFLDNNSSRNGIKLQLTRRFLKHRGDNVSDNSLRTTRTRLQSILVRKSFQASNAARLTGDAGALAVETQLVKLGSSSSQPKRNSRTSCSILINQSSL